MHEFLHRTVAKLKLLISVEHSLSEGTKECSPCKINMKESRSCSHLKTADKGLNLALILTLQMGLQAPAEKQHAAPTLVAFPFCS